MSSRAEIEAMHYNALALHYGVHSAFVRRLAAEHRSWEKAYRAAEGLGLFRASDPEKAWRALTDAHVTLVLHSDAGYPPLLRAIPEPPFGIYVRGTLDPAPSLAIAIVGTRKATESGAAFTRGLAEDLARRGTTIVSGLALGIDAAGHEGCLTGGGTTIAVLARGLDRVHPECHERLAQKILESGGALVSEYPFGVPAYKTNFLARNRIVSGLSRGVVVVEAPERSGALVSARYALEQGRDVFVVPGPAAHPNFVNSHRLIREGAELVTSADDVLAAYGVAPLAPAATNAAPHPDDSDEMRAVVAALAAAPTPLHIDKIAELTNLKVQIVAQVVGALLIAKRVREEQSGYRTHLNIPPSAI